MRDVNVDDWREVIVWFLLALPAIIGAVAGILGLRRAKANGQHAVQTAEDMRVVREQVENTHTSNLRDDIDVLRDEVRALTKLVTRVDDKASRIGDELRTENKLRRDADARTNGKVDAAIEWATDVIAKHHPEDSR
ncbi:DUF2746 domain-containing protein [Gordonia sp. PP30]|uniref:DUF2746 domain-containing protein n=1 Tax=Gordonia sp. PP30 TaxID=2935861 RepID=UPI001FFFF12F|nr:DUF2746 domain-containing protein [Gordonia sp. PP30]UQE73830.1 DUF2746 domain-containing protein [Gordonia sp. PP30]